MFPHELGTFSWQRLLEDSLTDFLTDFGVGSGICNIILELGDVCRREFILILSVPRSICRWAEVGRTVGQETGSRGFLGRLPFDYGHRFIVIRDFAT
jgi:hypothetical protein